jgi:PKD repeat protein
VTGTEQAHTYDEPGQYTAELTVTDADGESATEQVDIEVADAPVVEAPRAGAAITVNGRLDEAPWDGAPTTSFAADDATDGRVEISALWEYEHLVFGFRVTDDSIAVDPETDRWRNDGIEVFLDPFLERDSTLAHDNHKWISQAGGELSYSLVRGKSWSPLTRDIPVEHAVERTDTGYAVEVRYEWGPANTLLEPGTEIGMSVIHHDRDGGVVDRRMLPGG